MPSPSPSRSLALALATLLAGCSGGLAPRDLDASSEDTSLDATAEAGVSPIDGGRLDASDPGLDAAPPDGGPRDAGPPPGPRDAGRLDAGRPDAGPPDAGPPPRPDAGPADAGAAVGPCPGSGTEVLAEREGMFFTPSVSTPKLDLNLGGMGTCYQRVEVCFDVRAGAYQPQRSGEARPREEHILFALTRNAPSSWGRYLMGTAAVSFPSASPHFRMFGRVEIAATGASSYTSASAVFNWANGTTYHHCCVLDGVTNTQRCELSRDGAVVATRNLAVAYLDPPVHLSTGLRLQIGAVPVADPPVENTPIGWVFSNLLVRASR
ncbi:MAG: hypothetical protein IT378_11030 [Sandaracinaceae bacterium]|nr:hypothetical protein [Sandaracinaceae bacterium]